MALADVLSQVTWIVAMAIAVAIVAVIVYLFMRRKRMPGRTVDFEFGETEQSKAFFDRNPKFWPAFENLMALTNKAFGRELHFESRLEDIGFNLGQTCRQDFLEVLFLAANGYGIGAAKT